MADVDFSGWLAKLGDTALDLTQYTVKRRIDAQYVQPFEIQRMKIQSLGADGMLYEQGYPTGQGDVVDPSGGLHLSGSTMMLLLLGGVFLLVMAEGK